jgi:adenosylmethionine-8-amino-7-oxononanoate aminotransferase
LRRFEDHPLIAETRQMGTIAALELKSPEGGYFAEIGRKLGEFYLEKNILLRPLGNVVYILPPYCTTGDDLERAYDVIGESLAVISN